MKSCFVADELSEVKDQLAIQYSDFPIVEEADTNFFFEEYKKLDKEFNTRIDLSYQNLVNFSQTKSLPIHRWFYYQEGYSPTLINNLVKYLKINKADSILFDPFAGSGTSLVAAKELAINSIGFEINPFSSYIGMTKTQNYSEEEIKHAENFVLPSYEIICNPYDKYELSIIEKLFDFENFVKIELLKLKISKQESVKVKQILNTALLCILQQVSYYKKAGNGLKKKKKYTFIDTFDAYDFKLKQIIEDLRIDRPEISPLLINDNCLNLHNYNIDNIDISIFSPPYPNCFDYYEVYKIELWVGEFIQTYSQLRDLRKSALTSNLNANLKKKNSVVASSRILFPILEYLNKQKLWDTKIPKMLNSYFSEMTIIIKEIYKKTRKHGYCVIVVGNSSYCGMAIPTDIILSEIGKEIGFKVKEIIVARRNETSSQQYDRIGKFIEYIRESIIIFQK